MSTRLAVTAPYCACMSHAKHVHVWCMLRPHATLCTHSMRCSMYVQTTPTVRSQRRYSGASERCSAGLLDRGVTPRPSRPGSVVAFSEHVNLLMLDDSGMSTAGGSPRRRTTGPKSQHSVYSGVGSKPPSVYGARPGGALDIKRALFHRYFEPEVSRGQHAVSSLPTCIAVLMSCIEPTTCHILGTASPRGLSNAGQPDHQFLNARRSQLTA